MQSNSKCTAKPFLKWAGGKAQLINQIRESLPAYLENAKDLIYVEPFIGSGALLFWFLRKFPNTKKVIINDINPDLYKAFCVIKGEPENLIKELTSLQSKYISLDDVKRKDFFLAKREEFNSRNLDSIKNSALLIFLNKTCYNGLYRVNSKGLFNVPFGQYKNPKICDVDTIRCDSEILQKVTILNGDYSETLKYLDSEKTFFYFDPPYKPISKSSSFNAYAADEFDDKEQERLRNFCKEIDSLGHYFLLSNSDLKNNDTENDYFDTLYKDFNIKRVKAKRSINSNSAKRGEIFELLISNFSLKTL
ncbi:MAG: DNA adenine methylase [Bacteroidales bacterium]|nr:MAG: DNA adenine methylase [Bacteroidales bacterium]